MKPAVLPAFLLSLIFAGSAVPGAAPAQDVNQCIDRCFATYSSTNGFTGTDLRNLCLAKCGNSGSSAPAGHYGAIAFGLVDGAEGISWGKTNRAEAERSAMASCEPYGANCKIVFDYDHTCAALAVAKGAAHFTTATASSAGKAKTSSEAVCRRNWGVCLSDKFACSP